MAWTYMQEGQKQENPLQQQDSGRSVSGNPQQASRVGGPGLYGRYKVGVRTEERDDPQP